jgi:anti-sigma B factor antagonist
VQIHTAQAGQATRMEVVGELDVASAPLLEEAVTGALEAGRRDLVVDLANTTFLDSSGLSALIRAARAVEAARGSMTVHSPHGSEARLVIDLSDTAAIVGLRDP